jgi:putative NADPH-quinone reductase
MARNILVINGHPDPSEKRLCAALAGAYVRGAHASGYQIRRIDVGALDFPMIRTREEFENGAPPPDIKSAQEALAWADHLVILHPLWLGAAPALLKGFIEQVFRYGVALSAPGGEMKGLLKGKSARVVITMGMPAPIFRWVFGAYGLKSLERGVLWLSGFKPITHTVIGSVESAGTAGRWLPVLEQLGRQGS